MIVLNERTQIEHAIRLWIEKYGLDRSYVADKRGRRVGSELAALDQSTATAEQVAEIIGNSSWVMKLACDECAKVTWDIVQLGEPPDYESCTAKICGDCLRAALLLLSDSKRQQIGDRDPVTETKR